MSKPKRYMRNFLLDKRFQLKYTAAVVVLSSIIAVTLGTFLYQAHRESSQVSSLGDPDLDGALAEELAAEDHKVLFSLVAFLGGLVVALSVLGIMATHKIAGPAYAMRRILSLIADGKLPEVRALRKGDELRAVADELRRMTDTLRVQEAADLALFEQVLAAVRSGSTPDTAKLEAAIEEKKQRLAS